MKMIRWPITLMVLAVVALAMPLVASADHAWGKYSWPASGKLTLTLGNNLTGSWPGYLTDATSDWDTPLSGPDVLDVSVGAGNPNNSIDCTPESGAVEICNYAYGENGWLGIAGIWIAKGKQITKGYVKVNDTYFNGPDYNTSPWRQMVMCQEVGHIFGLAHQDENFDNANLGTCMDYTSNPEGPLSNVQPDQHDYDQLLAIYGSGDGGGGGGKGGGKPNGGGKGKPSSAPGADISQWGKVISTDGRGRPDLFELDLGNGNRLLTHVLWAK